MKKLLLLIFATVFLGSMQMFAQNWVGSESCKGCHSNKYADWADSGHPYKFNVTAENEAPFYPLFVENYLDTWLNELGDGTNTWDNIAGVIGGFGWKARFVGNDGIIIGTASSAYSTGMGHNQINFFDGEELGWSNFEKNTENKFYNYSCFKCHTTGGKKEGTWLEGVDGLGTFTEQGIGCESCHGPGGDHIIAGDKSKIERVYRFAHVDNLSGGLTIYGEVTQVSSTTDNDVTFLCGTCHNRSYANPINSNGGFIEHHEQWDEFVSSTHGKGGSMSCVTCHDPHKRVIWDGDGITKNCETCHSTQEEVVNHGGSVGCIDCHMPYAAKSGSIRGKSGFKGDVRSHLLKISIDGESMFTEDGKNVQDDATREAALSLHYTCLGCHNDDPDDNIPDKTIEQAIASATNMHVKPSAIAVNSNINMNIYPNPAVGSANISFTLYSSELVDVDVYNLNGQLIFTQGKTQKFAGVNTVKWDGSSNSGYSTKTGIYFVKVSIGNNSTTQKLIFIK